MKKFVFLLSTILCCTIAFLSMSGCTEEHVHSFDKEVVSDTYKAVDATCINPAQYYYSCECGATASATFELGPALGHLFNNYVYDRNATCGANGTETARCERYGCAETDTIEKIGSALSHVYHEINFIWNGSQCTAMRICTRDATHVDTETVTGTFIEDTPATCTTPATGHYKATFQNPAFSPQETAINSETNGEQLNHKYGPATYTWTGSDCFAKCVCQNNTSHKKTETATGTYIKDSDATCTSPEKGHFVVSFESDMFTSQQSTKNSVIKGEALGHDWSSKITKEATCAEPGSKLYTCNRCNDSKTEAIEIPHDIKTKEIAPTCDSPGYTLSYCKNCTYGEKEGTLIPSKEHSGSNKCSLCNKTYFEILGSFIKSEGVSGTSNGKSYYMIPYQDGNITYAISYYPTSQSLECLVYYKSTSSEMVFNLKMDSTSNVYDWDLVLASGSYMIGYLTASNITSNTSSLPYSSVYPNTSSIAKAANEAAVVYLKYALNYFNVILQICPENMVLSNFGFSNYNGVSHHKHSWRQSTISNPSCTSNGSVAYKCTSCSVTKTENIPSHGHVFAQSTSTRPSCTQGGVVEEKCYFCSYVQKTEIPGGNSSHSWNNGIVTTEPTCNNNGVKTYTCTACGETKTETTDKLTNHSWNNGIVTTEPTCNSNGVKTYTCTACGETKTETIDKLTNHSWNNGIVTTEPTCNNNGVKTYTCTACGETKTETIDKLTNHSWNNGAVTTEPTCNSNGVKTYTCTACGETKTETIDKLTSHVRNGMNVCAGCGTDMSTAGLKYSLSADGTYYIVSGVGTTTATEIYIASIYNNKPVTAIMANAFQNCTRLTAVEIPSSITKIGSGAFAGCTSLVRMVIPFVGGSIKTEQEAYQYPFGYIFGETYNANMDTAKQYYYDADTSKRIVKTFYLPKNLKTVVIRGGNILHGAFDDCKMIESITLPNNITKIGGAAFRNCKNLKTIEVPETVTFIASWAFSGCSNLSTIAFNGANVTGFGDEIIKDCSSLSKINYNGSKSSWNSITKGKDWNLGSASYIVYCKDGNINK